MGFGRVHVLASLGFYLLFFSVWNAFSKQWEKDVDIVELNKIDVMGEPVCVMFV